MSFTIPTFAVVGHPNKGKSSIVSTLIHSDDIEVSQRSGTTEKSSYHPINLPQGEITLVDTPGFQRPSGALKWLKARTNDASERSKMIEQFVQSSDCQKAFPDEVELLAPIVKGAAILYVVDGSRPYGPEYEVEMEILRWTGRPSMALINPIENQDYVEQWSNALTQYFKSVKVFNPMTAEFDKKTALFKTFAHLDERWSEQLIGIDQGLQTMRKTQLERSVEVLENLVKDACFLTVEQKTLTKAQASATDKYLKKQFESRLTQLENNAFQHLLEIYQHPRTEFSSDSIELPPDLFDTEQWYLWGLSKKQLITASTLAGAVAGASVDVFTAGSTLFAGTLGGGIIGAASAVFASDKVASLKISGIPTSGYTATYGPISNRNFPYVIIGRFLFFHKQVSHLNHADRRGLTVSSSDFKNVFDRLEDTERKRLVAACDKLSKQQIPQDLHSVLQHLATDNLSIRA